MGERQLLEAVTRQHLVKTQETGVVNFRVCELAIAL
jgi:hypothetical protein